MIPLNCTANSRKPVAIPVKSKPRHRGSNTAHIAPAPRGARSQRSDDPNRQNGYNRRPAPSKRKKTRPINDTEKRYRKTMPTESPFESRLGTNLRNGTRRSARRLDFGLKTIALLLTRLGLRFEDPAQENKYKASLAQYAVRRTRIAMGL